MTTVTPLKSTLLTTGKIALMTMFLSTPSSLLMAEEKIHLSARPTLNPVELNPGETIKFQRTDAETITIQLVDTGANVLFTNRDRLPESETEHDNGNKFRARLLYEFSAEIIVDGQAMTLRRYVSSQESFYEPYVINGVRLWLDSIQDIFEQHGGFLSTHRSENGMPDKAARFYLQDMTSRIAPERIHAPFIDGVERDENYHYKDNFLDVGRSFNGDDVYLGAYLGGQAHGALDVNMKMDSLMYTPFGVDTQEGIRFNGIRTWPDGSMWHFSLGHMAEKFIEDGIPVRAGAAFGRGASRATWWHPHAHFGFRIEDRGQSFQADPWMLLWQHFEDNKREQGLLRASMAPLRASKTGTVVNFHNTSTGQGDEKPLRFKWTFGDGGWSDEEHPSYFYARPGIYPVTLTTISANGIAAFTQHITVTGDIVSEPALALFSQDEPCFRPRPLDAKDVYGWPIRDIPHSLIFTARPTRPIPEERTIEVRNIGSKTLRAIIAGVEYLGGQGWLTLTPGGEGNDQLISVSVDATGLPPGIYHARGVVHSDGAINSPQRFAVELRVPQDPPHTPKVVIDNKDDGFYATPYFWIGHRFHGWGWPPLAKAKGHNNFYLMNGLRAKEGEFARFTPDLEAGWYTLWLHEDTPLGSAAPAEHIPSRFQIRIRHADGEDWVWMEPEPRAGHHPRPFRTPDGWSWLERQPTRVIGSYRFQEGTDGFVEIHAADSTGQVLVDAIRFLRWWRD